MATGPEKAAPGSLQNIWTGGHFFLLFWLLVHHGLRKGLFVITEVVERIQNEVFSSNVNNI